MPRPTSPTVNTKDTEGNTCSNKEELWPLLNSKWRVSSFVVLCIQLSCRFILAHLNVWLSLHKLHEHLPYLLRGKKEFNSWSLNGQSPTSPPRTYLRVRPAVWWAGPWGGLSPSSSLSAASAALFPSFGEQSFSAAGERPVQWLLLTLLSPWPE